jgi:hypothetical protein
MNRRPVIYVGYDERDHRAYEVLEHSIRKYNNTYDIIPLLAPELRRIGLYRRASRVFEHNPHQRYDVFDNKPFSTDFTFTRFLVPALNQYQGLALFMDADMLVRADIEGIFGVYGNRTQFAVQCVKHKYEPPEGEKMDGVAQTRYRRKNWSSFMLFNCSHPSLLGGLTMTRLETYMKNGTGLMDIQVKMLKQRMLTLQQVVRGLTTGSPSVLLTKLTQKSGKLLKKK